MRTEQTLRRAWEELAAAVADTSGDAAAQAALSRVVVALERAAGASLGPADGEDLAVLQRRFARAHRLGATMVGRDLVQQQLAALRCPVPATSVEHSLSPVTLRAGTCAAAGWCRP
jgi:hypothetical protein